MTMNVAVIGVCLTFTGLLITIVTKLMNQSVRYGELLKMVDIIQQQARTNQKATDADIAELRNRLLSVEKEQTSTAIVIARIDENMQTVIQQIAKLEAKLDKK